jgi:signal transduction histidine kinase
MYQLFGNLVSNAIKHNDSNNPEIYISRSGDVDGRTHRFVVRDNGPGIEESKGLEIFSPFVKGVRGGTGIGLSIVKKIVDVYSGCITAYNCNGACFEFLINDEDTTGNHGHEMERLFGSTGLA